MVAVKEVQAALHPSHNLEQDHQEQHQMTTLEKSDVVFRQQRTNCTFIFLHQGEKIFKKRE